MASTLSGPIERRLSSLKVMPAEPSGPVITTSPSWTTVPTVTGIRCLARSIETVPLATLIWPTSAAAAAPAGAVRVSATMPTNATRTMILECMPGLRGAHLY